MPDTHIPTSDPLTRFAPVPVPRRHDGWTAERQRLFILTLADTGSVGEACDAVDMNPRSAYRLRRRPGAEAFAQAWDQALVMATHRLVTIAYERALYGNVREVWHKGERVGEQRVPSDRLLMFLLTHMDKSRFGKLSGLLPVDVPDPRGLAARAMPRLLDRLHDLDPADADDDAPLHVPPPRG